MPQKSLFTNLREFKERFCDENVLIAESLSGTFSPWILPTVLDVGAGLGDIADAAFPDIAAILLDCEPYPASANPSHRRLTADFFEFAAGGAGIQTALFVHVFQYLDDDMPRLLSALEALNARIAITVTNDNTGAFGEIMDWALVNVPGANPERHIELSGVCGYTLRAVEKISAELAYPDFEAMAKGFISVLLDAPATPSAVAAMQRQLVTRLPAPRIEIDQTVRCYEQA